MDEVVLTIERRTGVTLRAAGKGDMDEVVQPGRAFRLVFVRVHWGGTRAIADLTLSLDANAGEEYDTTLYVYASRGLSSDAHLIVPAEELQDPTPWSFVAKDGLRLTWDSGNNEACGWGIEIGIAY